MAKSSIVIDIDDPRSGAIAEVMSNKTSKKILSMLAEGEMSSSELAEKLDLPLNTVTYNVEKLVKAELVEKSSRIFWSSRGRKMEIYRVSNRRIIISPKKIVKGILPALLVTLLISAAILLYQVQNRSFETQDLNQYSLQSSYDSETAGGVVASGAPAAQSESAAPAEALKAGASAPNQARSEAASEKSLLEKLQEAPNSWAWYLIGGMSALVIVLLWRMFKDE
jgi:DNA-binding transcriptional ArsR family regulator